MSNLRNLPSLNQQSNCSKFSNNNFVLNHQSKFKPTTMTSPDIRAGVSLLLAALAADGESTIHNVEQIDRGYQNIDKRLNAIGAQITRVD